MTSGAIQYGVPMNVFLLPTVRSSWALTPKSTGEETVRKLMEDDDVGLLKWTDVDLGTHPALLRRSQSAGRSGL